MFVNGNCLDESWDTELKKKTIKFMKELQEFKDGTMEQLGEPKRTDTCAMPRSTQTHS